MSVHAHGCVDLRGRHSEELALSFHRRFRDCPQAIRCDSKCLSPLHRHMGPTHRFLVTLNWASFVRVLWEAFVALKPTNIESTFL